jgi:uncharacterized membrane protein YjgN (DUF898 family)/tetratricopeptide (TPR) repeat protein
MTAVYVALWAQVLCAQFSTDAGKSWREKMDAAEESENDAPILKEALGLAEKFGESDVRLLETVVSLARSCEYDEGCEKEFGAYFQRALRLRERVRPEDAHLADVLMRLGQIASYDHAADALAVYAQALRIRERLAGPTDRSVAEVHAAMAWPLFYQNDRAKARESMQRALEILEKAPGEQTKEFVGLLRESAKLYGNSDDWPRAESEYRRAIAIAQDLWGPTDPEFIDALRDVAHENWGDGARFAEELYRRIVQIQEQVHTARSEEYFQALMDLGAAIRSSKRPADAEPVFEQALAVRQRLRKRDRLMIGCLDQIARCRLDRGLYTQAAEAAETGLEIASSVEPKPDHQTFELLALLAEVYLRAGDEARSEDAFRRFVAASTALSRYQLAEAADKLSTIYQERGDYTRATEKLEFAIAMLEVADPEDSRLPDKMMRLSGLYQAMGRLQEANRVSMAALRVMGRSVSKTAERDPQLRRRLMYIAAFVFVLPMLGALLGGAVYWLCSREVDRKLALLFVPPKPAPVPPPLPGFAFGALVEHAEAAPAPVALPLPEPAAPPALPLIAPPAEPPVTRVGIRAEGSVLFAMRVRNLLLSILTLGIYSFWGKAKVRRYVCGQAEYQEDRFAFHGTGRELLFGWLRALPALAFIVLAPNIVPIAWQNRYAILYAQLAALVVFAVLWPIARVGSYRYRLNRMSWRGIRFSYRGSALRYLAMSLGGWLLAVPTLGMYYPFLQNRLQALLLNETYFGDRPFRYDGRGSDLVASWIFALPLGFCTFGLGWAWWSALSSRYYWAHTTFGSTRFRCTATGLKLLWLWIGNLLIIAPTIGLGTSWAMLRTLRFWTRHIQLVGDPEVLTIRQDARAAAASAESFADFLGFDFGF